MNAQKVFFAENLKLLRNRKKLSQEAMAETLGIGRSKYNALENGQTKAPQPEDLIHFSNTFKISIDSLLRIDLSKVSELKLRELEAGSDIYLQGGKVRVLAISVDKSNKENVEYVPIKVKAGYMAGYNDPEFIASLPKVNLPNLPKGKSYRMFPIIGDSMHPIPEGSDVITSFVEDWTGIKPKTACIVILNGNNDFVFKLVTVQNDKTILLESLNKLYKPYSVTVAEVLEIWQFHSYQTKELPTQETDLDEIKRMIISLRNL
ncbi:XRE family transcriptional regulator [Pedobacter borealis]|uniref:XRE family transcriptional regulator n=1 Tax=Pedobacter borealis TaxID=475254 RepID=UPI000493513C|nr:helix-turn-helix domain-containing protein [Pedobacter borealis]